LEKLALEMYSTISRALISLLLLAAWASHAAVGQSRPDHPGSGTTYLLAIGVCPPYRVHIPEEICQNAVKAISDKFPDALGIDAGNVISMTNAEATGPKVLEQLSKLSQTLGASDRLIVYVILHGDAFILWANYYQSKIPARDKAAKAAVAAINENHSAKGDDVLVFWTESEPTVPALALAEKDWLSVAEFVSALDEISGNVAFIIDSCSSNRYFSSLHNEMKVRSKIDFVLASAGSEQISNFNEAKTMPLFTSQLLDALNLPTVGTFGQAIAYSRVTTVLHAAAQCSMMTIPAKNYRAAFPTLDVPAQKTHDDQVSPPLWYCAQVPVSVDYTGDMTSRPLFGAKR